MRFTHRLCAVLLVAALLVPRGIAADKPWVEVRSKNFSLITDTGEKRGREVLLRFEQMRAAFAAMFARAKVNIPVPLQIIAFGNSKQFKDYVPLWKGKPVDWTGFYRGSDDRNFIALDLAAGEEGFAIVFHEYAHMLLNANLPPSPVWFDEGYAEYFSSLSVSSKYIEFGRIPENLPRVIQENSWLKTVELFSVQHNSKEYNEQDRRSIFYAQSWLTVHYIMEKHLGKQLDAYLNLARTGTPVADAISKGFGMEPAKLDKALQDYFRGGQMQYVRLPAPANIEGGPYEVRPLAPLQVEAILADLDYHSLEQRERGIARFRQILEKDPDNVLANRGLGYALMQKNDLQAAAPYIERAAAKDQTDARLHYLHAMLLYRSPNREESEEQVRTELEKAIAIDPSYADAYSLLAFTDAMRGDRDAALEHARKAVELNPRGEHLRFNLAMAQMQAQDFAGARTTLTELQASSNPMLAAQARQNLEQLAQMEEATSRRQRIRVEPGELRPVDVKPREPEPAPAPPPVVEKRPVKFLKGRLTAIDCSATPAAVLKVMVQGKTVELHVADVRSAVVIGADKFSCAWKNRNVAVNYRPAAAGGGDVVSLELQ